MTVAFDCDGTLIDYTGAPREDVIQLLKTFSALGATIYVWSGGGVDYAKNIVRKLQLESFVDAVPRKGQHSVDLAVDDQHVNLGQINFRTNPLETF